MKMKKPTMEIVRFDAEDVIATSGVVDPYANLHLKTSYLALKEEAAEASIYKRGKFVTFYLNDDRNGLKDVFGNNGSADISSFRYAWFNAGQWQTENKRVSTLGYDKNDLSNWRRQ